MEKGLNVSSHPELLYYQSDLGAVEKLSLYDKNDSHTALLDVVEAIDQNIAGSKPSGYLNAIKHVFGQAIITTLRGRSAADFAGDIHERQELASVFAPPEKQHGNLTAGFATQSGQQQRVDTDLIDTYVDLVNNIYGQDLGEQLKADLGISSSTYWTPELTAEYLNSVQKYLGNELGLQIKDFDPASDTVKKFANLINEVQMVETPPAEIERQQYEVLGMPH